MTGLPMQSQINQVVQAVGEVLVGKEEKIRLALCCLVARGHLLVEDLPGMGKTTLSHALARALGLDYQRIQFTSDLLPADIIGVSVFNRDAGSFEFHPGPVFTQILLADEVNRATPKTQSALLEAMAEQQVTSDGKTRPLPNPFFVIATQNPEQQGGTFALPESQLDRFTMRIQLGYPDPVAERKMLSGLVGAEQLTRMQAVLSGEQLMALQEQVEQVKTSESLLDYLQRLVAFTRLDDDIGVGLSPRAVLALLRCAKAWAAMEGRDYVIPEDLQQVLPAVTGHRLRDSAHLLPADAGIVHRLLSSVDVLA
jgi:MoxR-like ATPase